MNVNEFTKQITELKKEFVAKCKSCGKLTYNDVEICDGYILFRGEVEDESGELFAVRGEISMWGKLEIDYSFEN